MHPVSDTVVNIYMGPFLNWKLNVEPEVVSLKTAPAVIWMLDRHLDPSGSLEHA